MINHNQVQIKKFLKKYLLQVVFKFLNLKIVILKVNKAYKSCYKKNLVNHQVILNQKSKYKQKKKKLKDKKVVHNPIVKILIKKIKLNQLLKNKNL